jgi:hypothetical protein
VDATVWAPDGFNWEIDNAAVSNKDIAAGVIQVCPLPAPPIRMSVPAEPISEVAA